jgi:hypothetical protein
MTSQPNPVSPPHAAAWLIRLFADAEEAELILGDLSEEFSRLASESGDALARRWYWRQALKSLPHLVVSAFRMSPWLTTAAVAAGFLLRRQIGPLVEPATFALIDKFGIYQNHFTLYRFLASTALDIEHAISFFFVGCFVALLARKREMAPAVALAIVYAAMALVASVNFVIRGGDYGYLLRLSWYFTDSLAVVLGAALVRTLRPDLGGRPLPE